MIFESINTRPLGEYDVCIIGSGPAGLVLALELARQNQRVLVLESGKLEPDAAQQALSQADIADPTRHDDMAIAVSRQLGGTSNLWGARCQPFDPIDFEKRTVNGDAGWPLPYSEISPYYDRAVDYLGAGEAIFEAPLDGVALHNTDFATTHLERFANVPAVQKHHREELASSPMIDIRLMTTLVDIGFEDGRITNLIVADETGKQHVLNPALVVLACGGLETTRQLLVLQKKHPTLFGGTDGPLGRYYMGHLIGEVADITLHSEALDAAMDFFIDAHGSYARRRVTPSDALIRNNDLLNICFWPVVPPVADARHKSSILSMVCLALAIKPIGRVLVAEAIRKRHIPDVLEWWPHIRNVILGLPSAVGFLASFFYRRYISKIRLPGLFVRNPGRRYGLSYHAEQSPKSDSRVMLTDTVDRLGVPQLSIDLKFAREDAEAIFRTHELLAEWLDKTGIGKLDYRQGKDETVDAILAIAAHGTHQIGTVRMGLSPEDAVVDQNLKCFGIDNLYVASSAAFPTSGQCNPTLSIAAFSVRLAEHLTARKRAE